MSRRSGLLLTVSRMIGVGIALVIASSLARADDAPFPGADPALIAAAKAEGVVTLYCTQDEDISHATARAFEKAVPGITVRVLRLASVQLYSRLAAEKQAGVHEVDVFCSGDTTAFTDNPDWWVELAPEIIPTVSLLPERAIHPNFLITSQGVAMMAYNTIMLSPDEAPKHWTDVVKPQFKGKGLFVDPRNSTTYMTWLDYMDEVYGDDFIRQLGQQEFQLVSAGSPGAQEVAAGGAAFVFPVTRSHVIPVIAKGAPIATIEPWLHSDIAATGSETSFGIASDAPHPNAARVYLSWLLTAPAQKVNCGGAYASLSLPKDDHEGCPAFAEKFEPQRYLSQERRNELLELLNLQ